MTIFRRSNTRYPWASPIEHVESFALVNHAAVATPKGDSCKGTCELLGGCYASPRVRGQPKLVPVQTKSIGVVVANLPSFTVRRPGARAARDSRQTSNAPASAHKRALTVVPVHER